MSFATWVQGPPQLALPFTKEPACGIEMPNHELAFPFSHDNVVYITTDSAIYRVRNGSLENIALNLENQLCRPFFYEGRLTAVVNFDGQFQLRHHVDGQWIDGRTIVLPRPGAVWQHDPETDRDILRSPIAMKASSANSNVSIHLQVIPHQNEVYLMVNVDVDLEMAARHGFDFAEPQGDLPAGLAAENGGIELSGWSRMTGMADGCWRVRGCDQISPVLSNTDRGHSYVIRLSEEGNLEHLFELTNASTINNHILVEPSRDGGFLIEEDWQWGAGAVRRFKGTTLEPPHLILSGYRTEYLDRWKLLGLAVVAGWWMHIVIVAVALFVTVREKDKTFCFGHRTVKLAPPTRRTWSPRRGR